MPVSKKGKISSESFGLYLHTGIHTSLFYVQIVVLDYADVILMQVCTCIPFTGYLYRMWWVVQVW